MNWISDTELNVSYKHNLSSDYRPFLNLDGIDYSIALDMNLDSDSIFSNSWDGWSWHVSNLIENPLTEVHARVEHGKVDHGGSAPITRILLEGKNNEPQEVWSGTEVSTKPQVIWLNAETLKVSVIDLHSYSFYPAKKLDKQIYKIVLEVR